MTRPSDAPLRARADGMTDLPPATVDSRTLAGRTDAPEEMTPMARLAPALFASLFLVAVPKAGAEDPAARYDKVHKITIGGEGGWDFLEVDPGARRLYVTRGNRVVVVDLDSESAVGEIADTPGVHGVAFVPDLGRGFTSNGRDSSVTVFDTKTLKTLGKVKANGRPDIIYFEPVSRRVVSSCSETDRGYRNSRRSRDAVR